MLEQYENFRKKKKLLFYEHSNNKGLFWKLNDIIQEKITFIKYTRTLKNQKKIKLQDIFYTKNRGQLTFFSNKTIGFLNLSVIKIN